MTDVADLTDLADIAAGADRPLAVAIIYYSLTGSIRAMASAAASAATEAGASVRLLSVDDASPADLLWAEVVLFGSPTRFGTICAEVKRFIDSLGELWRQGQLADKTYGAFVSTASAHGGQETTIQNFTTIFSHWGGIIVPPGFTDPIQFQSGNPHGASHVSVKGSAPSLVAMEAARYQARRAIKVGNALRIGRAAQSSLSPKVCASPARG